MENSFIMKQCVLLSLALLFTWSSTSEAFPIAIASSRSNGTKKFDLFGDIRETSEKTTKLDMMKELNRTDAHQAVAGTQSLTKWDDLALAGLNARKLQFKYSIIYGSKPDIDDIYLNNDIAHKYGYFSYNYLGDVNVSNVHTEPKTTICNERYLVNDSDGPMSHTVSLSSTVSNSASTTVTKTSSVSTTLTFSIGFSFFGISISFSVDTTFTNSNSVGSTDTHSSDVNVGDTVSVVVPPHSKRRIGLNVTWTRKTADWEIPVRIDPKGMTAAKHGDDVWGLPHNFLGWHPPNSVVRGRMEAIYDTKGTVVLEDAVAL